MLADDSAFDIFMIRRYAIFASTLLMDATLSVFAVARNDSFLVNAAGILSISTAAKQKNSILRFF